MRAVAYFGGLWGVFLAGFMEITIDGSSIIPKVDNKSFNAERVVSAGYWDNGYLSRTVVSKGPVVTPRNKSMGRTRLRNYSPS